MLNRSNRSDGNARRLIFKKVMSSNPSPACKMDIGRNNLLQKSNSLNVKDAKEERDGTLKEKNIWLLWNQKGLRFRNRLRQRILAWNCLTVGRKKELEKIRYNNSRFDHFQIPMGTKKHLTKESLKERARDSLKR